MLFSYHKEKAFCTITLWSTQHFLHFARHLAANQTPKYITWLALQFAEQKNKQTISKLSYRIAKHREHLKWGLRNVEHSLRSVSVRQIDRRLNNRRWYGLNTFYLLFTRNSPWFLWAIAFNSNLSDFSSSFIAFSNFFILKMSHLSISVSLYFHGFFSTFFHHF